MCITKFLNTVVWIVLVNPVQSTTIGLNDLYHNLASLVRVKQNLCTFATSGKLWVSIQPIVLKRWASASSSGLPEFNWGCTGFGTWAGGDGGGSCCTRSAFCTASYFCCAWEAGGVTCATRGLCTVGSFSAGGLLSAIVAYLCSLT